MSFLADLCAARASFRVSLREESLFLRAGRKVLPRGGGRCKVHIHRGWRMETFWWSYAVQSYGGIQQMIRIAPRIEDCWRRRCGDRFRVPDWLVWFVCRSEGGRWWRV